MRKVISCLLLLALLAAMCLSASALEIAAPKGTIVIDGKKDAAYGAMFDIKEKTGSSSADGAVGKAAIAWDGQNVYMYVEVNDKTPNHVHGNAYERDCVEFFFDWHSEVGSDSGNNGKDYWQVRITSGPAADGSYITGFINGASIAAAPENKDIVDFVIVPLSGSDLSNGYIIEAAFKAPKGVELKEGGRIKFDMQVADNLVGSRGSQAFTMSSPLNDQQYQNPSACMSAFQLVAAGKGNDPVTAPATTTKATTTRATTTTAATSATTGGATTTSGVTTTSDDVTTTAASVEDEGGGLSMGVIIGIIAGAVVVIGVVVFVVMKGKKKS